MNDETMEGFRWQMELTKHLYRRKSVADVKNVLAHIIIRWHGSEYYPIDDKLMEEAFKFIKPYYRMKSGTRLLRPDDVFEQIQEPPPPDQERFVQPLTAVGHGAGGFGA